jgi:hypothetical protein
MRESSPKCTPTIPSLELPDFMSAFHSPVAGIAITSLPAPFEALVVLLTVPFSFILHLRAFCSSTALSGVSTGGHLRTPCICAAFPRIDHPKENRRRDVHDEYDCTCRFVHHDEAPQYTLSAMRISWLECDYSRRHQPRGRFWPDPYWHPTSRATFASKNRITSLIAISGVYSPMPSHRVLAIPSERTNRGFLTTDWVGVIAASFALELGYVGG